MGLCSYLWLAQLQIQRQKDALEHAWALTQQLLKELDCFPGSCSYSLQLRHYPKKNLYFNELQTGATYANPHTPGQLSAFETQTLHTLIHIQQSFSNSHQAYIVQANTRKTNKNYLRLKFIAKVRSKRMTISNFHLIVNDLEPCSEKAY